MMRCGGSGVRRTVARVMTPSVPSEPAKNFATSNFFSGSRCSIEYPETCRENRPNSVRITPRWAITSERSSGKSSRPRTRSWPWPSMISSSTTLSDMRP